MKDKDLILRAVEYVNDIPARVEEFLEREEEEKFDCDDCRFYPCHPEKNYKRISKGCCGDYDKETPPWRQGTTSDAVNIILDFKEEVIRDSIDADIDECPVRASRFRTEAILCDVIIGRICSKYPYDASKKS